MLGVATASSTVLIVLNWAARICIILFLVSILINWLLRRHRRPGGEADGTESALRSKITKLTRMPWGRYALGCYGWIFIGICVVIFIATAYAGLKSSETPSTSYHLSMIAESSPVNMFLQLDEDITLDEVLAQEGDRDWYFQEDFGITAFQKQVAADIECVSISYTWSSESVQGSDYRRNYEQSSEEVLELYFAVEDDGGSWLVCAYLEIKTDSGLTASCYYYPTDITQKNYKTGFNLTVKGYGQVFKHKYFVETAQEAVAIAYPLVYPYGQ